MLTEAMPSAGDGDGHHRQARQTTVSCDRAVTQQDSSARTHIQQYILSGAGPNMHHHLQKIPCNM